MLCRVIRFFVRKAKQAEPVRRTQPQLQSLHTRRSSGRRGVEARVVA